MTKFEVGKTYTHGWIGNSDLFTTWEVIARTAKTVTIKHDDEIKRCRIIDAISDKAECVFPFGKYSMCPILRAEW